MAVWTQRIRLRWQQNLSFYEQRYEVLRELEETGALRRFRHESDRIVVRLGSAHQLIGFGATGMNVFLLAPDADSELLRSAASLIWDRLKPHLIRDPVIGLQFLHEVNAPYDDTRTHAAQQLMGADVAAAPEDFALLLDGHDEALDARFRLELGVINAAEGPQRLSREAGRVVAGLDAETPSTLWTPDTLPKVALFCDQEWVTKAPNGNDSLDAIFDRVDATRSAAADLMDRFVSRLDLKALEA